jgi:hypothetical protein
MATHRPIILQKTVLDLHLERGMDLSVVEVEFTFAD